jgi:hypothetical protein
MMHTIDVAVDENITATDAVVNMGLSRSIDYVITVIQMIQIVYVFVLELEIIILVEDLQEFQIAGIIAAIYAHDIPALVQASLRDVYAYEPQASGDINDLFHIFLVRFR